MKYKQQTNHYPKPSLYKTTTSAKTIFKPNLRTKKREVLQFKPYQTSPLKETLQAYDAMDKDTLTAQKTTVANPMYYYHPDHLGTSTALTDVTGEPYQFFLNLPYGETMAEQLGSHYYNSPYKFNGKELDEETGLYYYGARYYDPKVSNWLSVDPLAEKFPNASPYNYCLDNPINIIDPDGRDIILVHGTWSEVETWKNLKSIQNASNNLFGDRNLGQAFP